jgi:hypothetical protein
MAKVKGVIKETLSFRMSKSWRMMAIHHTTKTLQKATHPYLHAYVEI